jgi:hypothetical protein
VQLPFRVKDTPAGFVAEWQQAAKGPNYGLDSFTMRPARKSQWKGDMKPKTKYLRTLVTIRAKTKGTRHVCDKFLFDLMKALSLDTPAVELQGETLEEGVETAPGDQSIVLSRHGVTTTYTRATDTEPWLVQVQVGSQIIGAAFPGGAPPGASETAEQEEQHDLVSEPDWDPDDVDMGVPTELPQPKPASARG